MRIFAILLACNLLCHSVQAKGTSEGVSRVLFVGNSLTYVGNLPAVFSSLAAANDQEVRSDMIVSGGATLTDRVRDGSVAKAIEGGDYDALILQERGGDLICAFGPESCIQSRESIISLATLAKSNGMRVLLLGTYQRNPGAALSVSYNEAEAAEQAGVFYVDLGAELQRFLAMQPDGSWFAEDGMHPGSSITLLAAILLFEAFYDSLPGVDGFYVDAPIYSATSGLKGQLRESGQAAPIAETPSGIEYSENAVSQVLKPMYETRGS